MSAPYPLRPVSTYPRRPLNQILRSLYRPLLDTDCDDPYLWAGTDSYAACVNPNSGKLLATVWNDGCGNYDPTIYVSLAVAARMHASRLVVRVSLRPFPLCAIDLYHVTDTSIEAAKEVVEEVLAMFNAN